MTEQEEKDLLSIFESLQPHPKQSAIVFIPTIEGFDAYEIGSDDILTLKTVIGLINQKNNVPELINTPEVKRKY